MPRNRRSLVMSFGSAMSWMAWTLALSGSIPSSVFLFQTRTSACWAWGQRATLAWRLRRGVYHSLQSCRCTRLHHPCSTTPSNPFRMDSMVRWNISGAREMPKGRRLKKKLAQMVTEMLWVWPSFHLMESANTQKLHQVLKRPLLQPTCVWYHQQLATCIALFWSLCSSTSDQHICTHPNFSSKLARLGNTSWYVQ